MRPDRTTPSENELAAERLAAKARAKDALHHGINPADMKPGESAADARKRLSHVEPTDYERAARADYERALAAERARQR